jgi:hypothetical protein
MPDLLQGVQSLQSSLGAQRRPEKKRVAADHFQAEQFEPVA